MIGPRESHLLFVTLCKMAVLAKSETFQALFSTTLVRSASLKSLGETTGLQNKLGCAQSCVRHIPNCTAIAFDPVTKNCSFSRITDLYHVYDSSNPNFVEVIANKADSPPRVAHILTYGNGQMQDLSADSANSPAEPFAFEWEGKAGFQAAGMFWQGGFLSCGGKTSSITATDKCFHLTLGSESSTEYPSMKIPRVGHASTIYQGRLWVTGGEMGNSTPSLLSTELLQPNSEWEFGPDLPTNHMLHCITPMTNDPGETRFLLIGGQIDGWNSPRSYLFDWSWNNGSWVQLGDLSAPAFWHTCGATQLSNGQNIVLTTYGDMTSNAVDILNEGSTQWQPGPPIPFGRKHATLVNLSGRLLILGGRHNQGNGVNAVGTLELKADGSDWVKDHELQMQDPGSQEFVAVVYNT